MQPKVNSIVHQCPRMYATRSSLTINPACQAERFMSCCLDCTPYADNHVLVVGTFAQLAAWRAPAENIHNRRRSRYSMGSRDWALHSRAVAASDRELCGNCIPPQTNPHSDCDRRRGERSSRASCCLLGRPDCLAVWVARQPKRKGVPWNRIALKVSLLLLLRLGSRIRCPRFQRLCVTSAYKQQTCVYV